MSHSGALIEVVKRELKAQGKTYVDVARALSLSEASVKRLFSTANISLPRLDSICRLLNVTYSDLLARLESSSERLKGLTELQEQELVDNPRLLLVAVCALNHWQFQQILDNYELSSPDCIRLLAKLDRLGLIELLPNNRIKLLIHRNFSWLPNGPIQQFFRRNIQNDFFSSDFNAGGEYMAFYTTMLSRSSNAIIRRKLESLITEAHQLGQEDAGLPLSERFGTSLLIAMRPWELDLFEAMRRPGTDKQF